MPVNFTFALNVTYIQPSISIPIEQGKLTFINLLFDIEI